MKINYGQSFYDQHHYLKGVRNDVVSTNDTKWGNLVKRYQTLLDIKSDLIDNQPFGVIGNNRGFDDLLNLMMKSNYTFEDLNESLIDTYRVSLQNSISRNTVNTHSVMFKCNNLDKEHVTPDKFSHYYIIDVPFVQLHFGDRDEFIRQKLSEMHNTHSSHYIDISEFSNSEISSILNFTILCTVNGFICNDCKVAVDDKGFKFKVGWSYSSDVEFILYKLDECSIIKSKVNVSNIKQSFIPYTELNNIINRENVINKKCMINIFDESYSKTIPSVPNFGEFKEKGFYISNIQKRTLDDITRHKSKTVDIIIYSFKYIHEVPNVYPAINYYDMMDTRNIKTEYSDDVKDVYNRNIVSSESNNRNKLELTTPPIVIDRSVNVSFNTISACLSLKRKMLDLERLIQHIGQELNKDNITIESYKWNIKRHCDLVYEALSRYYVEYMKGAVLTSLVSDKLINRFKSFIDALNGISNITEVNQLQKYAVDELYEDNYERFVDEITKPFEDDKLKNFKNIDNLSKNYFVDENSSRFIRPVSEYNFITLKYDRSEEAWLFNLPTIKHFKGIGNAFYIDDELKGDEVFKFFVLYTDTESPSEVNVESFNEEIVLDFDLFCNEIEKHVGYIRYWYAENELMKLSNIFFNRYDSETSVQILSKIMKKKLSCNDILDVYPSEINYEQSNVTTDNIGAGENDIRAPFALNFLFYTLSMLNGNEDKLQTYFINHLTKNKFNRRYSDINISPLLSTEVRYPIDYSTISSPSISSDCFEFNTIDDGSIKVFYGVPYVFNNDNTVSSYSHYPYTFNRYDMTNKHYLVIENDIDESSHVISNVSGQHKICKNAHVIHELTLYLSYVYDYFNTLQTDYIKTFNQHSTIDSAIETISNQLNRLTNYINDNEDDFYYEIPDSVRDVIFKNPLLGKLMMLDNELKRITTCENTNVFTFINDIIKTMKRVYIETGFDNYSKDRIRMMYIHLKNINKPMNLYSYREWLNDIDMDLLSNLDSMIAENENYPFGKTVFTGFYNILRRYIDNVINVIPNVIKLIDGLYDEHITTIQEYCSDYINSNMLDLYTIDKIEYDTSTEYSTKPYVLIAHISSDKHLFGEDTDVDMVFQPIIDINNSSFVITNIVNICEYVIINDEPVECQMSVIDNNGSIISDISCVISFKKVWNNSTEFKTMYQLVNSRNQMINIQNVHEITTFDNGYIVNDKISNMNYEMYMCNKFFTLKHDSELVLNPDTMLPGPEDVMYISNQLINNIAVEEYTNSLLDGMYFKPSQVIHIPITDESIKSIGGKYFKGQSIYVITDDEQHIIPLKITAIDSSINSGFIEAVVDDKKSKWFKVNKSDVDKYLTTDVSCTIIDDNIRNFIDEFTNGSYDCDIDESVINIDNCDNVYGDMFALPGDPLFVQNNSDYVYKRISYMFNELLPNRFVDEFKRDTKLLYVGSSFINEISNKMTLKMLNHNFCEYTDSEMYPILRTEPNDHEIWDKEIEEFNRQKIYAENDIRGYENSIARLNVEMNQTNDYYEREIIKAEIDSFNRKIQSLRSFQIKMDNCIKQLENPTTWHNVHAYEDAMVYIDNGRAKIRPSLIPNIRNLVFTDTMQILIYDWEHKMWLDPKSYTVNINMVDGIKINEYDDYKTESVLYTIDIEPNDSFIPSRKLLIYMSYKQSDMDSIQMNDFKCKIKFKPLLDISNNLNSIDPYSDIRVRKHHDCVETYVFPGFNKPETFSIDESYHVMRKNRDSSNEYSPTIRLCDIKLSCNGMDYGYNDFDVYIKNPFRDIKIDRTFKTRQYDATINQPIDHFINGVRVKLICVQNNDISKYDGNMSSIMFEGITTENGIDIIDSTLTEYYTGSLVCTVLPDTAYKMCGGLVSVDVSIEEHLLMDEYHNWIKLYGNIKYHEIPDEFIIVPNVDVSGNTIITLSNEYRISDENIERDDVYKYYHNTNNNTRLPISDVVHNNKNDRLILNESLNPDVESIKSTYVNVCRYSSRRIPEDGFIDLTGYLPTPLSRDRYEFWINGRQISNPSDLIILSPTSIQLCNLKSLRNFEVIELVDDINESIITPEQPVYIGLDGSLFISYKHALHSNMSIVDQNTVFSYNIGQHNSIHDYIGNIIDDPNNIDTEPDILESIEFEDSNNYNDIVNIPSINGKTLYHLTTESIGISEIPYDEMISEFNKVWKYEMLTDPLFVNDHHALVDYTGPKFRIKKSDNEITITITGNYEKYFTLFISKNIDDVISDVNNVVKVIPFVRTGIQIIIDDSYQNMWLKSTVNTNSIKL